MRSFRTACVSVAINGSLFVCGGYGGGRYDLASCEMFPVDGNQWQSLPDMQHRRRACAAVAWHGAVVVMGGYSDDGVCLSQCEMFHPSSEHWIKLPCLQHPRGACVAVCAKLCLDGLLQDCVVVLGGVDSHGNYVAAIEILCYKTNNAQSSIVTQQHIFDQKSALNQLKWKCIGNMPLPRSHFAAVKVPHIESNNKFCTDKILVMGGSSKDSQFMRDVVLFDPQLQVDTGLTTITRAWQSVSPLRVPRAACTAAAHNGRVWVFGGWPKFGFSLKSVEYLDLHKLTRNALSDNESNAERNANDADVSCQWSFGPHMQYARGSCAVAVI